MWTHHRIEKQKSRRFWWIGQWWLHLSDRRCLSFEWSALSTTCHFGFQVGHGDSNDGWQIAIAFPPIALYLSFDGFNLPAPSRMVKCTWDEDNPEREFRMQERWESNLSVSGWTIRFTPWGRWAEWRGSDPWWIRGVSLDLKDFFLGKQKYSKTEETPTYLKIPMLEGNYLAKATIEHCVWKRPRWFADKRTYTSVDIEGGIPFPGKGENSWDCGMDGLFGYSCEGTKPEDAIARGVQSVMESRRRYAGDAMWRPPAKEAVDADDRARMERGD